MSLRVKVYGFLTLVALLATAGYLYKARPAWLNAVVQAKPTADPKAAKKEEKEATPVELALAKRGPISAYISSTANLRALRDIVVATQAEGVVLKVLAEEGDFVKTGQALCQLDDAQLAIRLELAEEKLAQAKLQMEKAGQRQDKTAAQIGHAQAEVERHQKAQKEGLISDKELATYRYRLEELRHDQKVATSETKELQHRVAELQAEIAQSKLEISRTQIRAPFEGYITQRTVNIGQRVRAMDGLFNLGAFSPLHAEVHLAERDAAMVRPGQSASVRLGSDESVTVQGRVERLSPVVDQASGTVKVTVALQPREAFRPGAFVRVEILTNNKPDAVLVPKRALVEEDGVNYVFIATADSARRTKVAVGYQSEGMVEIIEGVQPGQQIVVAGQGALKEGTKIRVPAPVKSSAPSFHAPAA